MDPILTALTWIIITIIVYFMLKAWKTNQYWKERGIPYVKPLPIVGNALPIFLGRKSPGELHEELFKQLPNEPYIGYYDCTKPVILVRSVDLIEKFLIKDFAHFVDHGLPFDEEKNPLHTNLISMCGKRWKAVRYKLSPIFTTGKLKTMYESMAECGNELVKQLEKDANNTDVEMKDILERFTMDTTGSCAFGIEAGNLSKPDNEFRRIGKKTLEMDLVAIIRMIILFHFPRLTKFFNVTFTKPNVVNYFAVIIKDTLKYRRENNFKRNDFIQLLMQLKDKGYVEMHTKDPADDYLGIDSNTYSVEKFDLTDEQITGHAVSFLTAGFEPTTNTLLYALYEISKNLKIHEKVREEVVNVVKQNGSLNYNAVKELVYLEQVVKETLRKYPPAQFLIRLCTKEYTLPNGLIIQPGQMVYIAVKAVHYDPRYYPEPEEFKPERFDPDKTYPSCAFIPFGNGPRICIGIRFALMEMKYCLAKLIMGYNFTISPKTEEPITLSARSFISAPKQKIYFNYSKIVA